MGQILAEFAVFFARQELLEERDVFAAQSGNHLHRLARSADHRPVVVVRSLAEEEVEDGNLVLHSVVVEGLAHRILIFVRAIGNIEHIVRMKV